jgi:hypothetical protein
VLKLDVEGERKTRITHDKTGSFDSVLVIARVLSCSLSRRKKVERPVKSGSICVESSLRVYPHPDVYVLEHTHKEDVMYLMHFQCMFTMYLLLRSFCCNIRVISTRSFQVTFGLVYTIPSILAVPLQVLLSV